MLLQQKVTQLDTHVSWLFSRFHKNKGNAGDPESQSVEQQCNSDSGPTAQPNHKILKHMKPNFERSYENPALL